ncbi:MAG TPA: DUF5652 family protein [Candidatus Paceibacterota bacterium]|jgi:hypothetical protein
MDLVALLSTEPSRTIIIALVVLWTLPWKGYAMWHAARLAHRWWFIAILILNTLAILEIFYIFVIVRRSHEMRESQQ